MLLMRGPWNDENRNFKNEKCMRVSEKRQEMLTLSDHMISLLFLVGSALYIVICF